MRYFIYVLSLLKLNISFLVDADEIKRLGKRFKKLDLDNSGSLSVDEFMTLPELQQNPLVQRVIDIFDTDGNGEVDFKGNLLIQNCVMEHLSYHFTMDFPENDSPFVKIK